MVQPLVLHSASTLTVISTLVLLFTANRIFLSLSTSSLGTATLSFVLARVPQGALDLANDEGFTPLMQAAFSGDAAAIAQLVTGGATLCCSSETHVTPMHLAALGGHAKCVEMLWQLGHPPDPVDVSAAVRG